MRVQAKTGSSGGDPHQPMSLPFNSMSSGETEFARSDRISSRSLTTNLVLPSHDSSGREDMDTSSSLNKDEGKTSLEDFYRTCVNQPELFDLQKIREKIDARKNTSADELRRAISSLAHTEHPPPQYVVYANNKIEELQFFLEM